MNTTQHLPESTTPTTPMASSTALMVANSHSKMSQETPNIDSQSKKPRWSDEEDKAICGLLKSQWQLEKDHLGKLNGTRFWPLISATLRECGFDRTPDNCRGYWYGVVRLRPEFKDTLLFHSVTERSSTPAFMASKTGAEVTPGPPRTGTRSSSGSLFNTGPEEAGSISKEINNTLGAKIGSSDTSGSIFQAVLDNTLGSMSETATKSGGDSNPRSMSQTMASIGSMARWSENETQKLRELVLAKRGSVAEDQQEIGIAFWKSISQQLENNQIHRTWQACARRFQRTNSHESRTTEPAIDPDETQSSSFHVDPYNEKEVTHLKSRIADEDNVEDDGSKSDLDDGDTPYGEDGERRRGTRKRVSRPAWTEEEHNRLVQLLKARRQLESEDDSLKKLSNNKLFALVSQQLKQYLIDRSGGACNLYWSSKGFARSGFDINPPATPHAGESRKSSDQQLSPVGKGIADAFSRIPHQDFEDSAFVQSFHKENAEHLSAGNKRSRGFGGIWDAEEFDGELNDLNRVKRRRSVGDALGNKEKIQTTSPNALGTSPGMVKRRAPKRDPTLPLVNPNDSAVNGDVLQGAGNGEGSSGTCDVELLMKMKIQDLENEISSLVTSKQETVSEMHGDESQLLSIHNKIELLQVQKQKLQQSRREKEGQLDVYSSKIEKLTSQKKHLEVALDIVGGRV